MTLSTKTVVPGSTISCPPSPELMESLRAVGYKFPDAIADIVDNSVAASARQVFIDIDVDAAEPYLTIADDGHGMSLEDAVQAMRLAESARRKTRSKKDLGKFGLGLKTASISQCRKLTVLSRNVDSARIVGVEWDLDRLVDSDEWSLRVLADEELRETPGFTNLDEKPSGTVVVWRNFDRYIGTRSDLSAKLQDDLNQTADHLSLIFHRFLSGEVRGQKLAIKVGRTQLKAVDPFLTRNPLSRRGPVELISVDGKTIEIQAHTLPQVSALSKSERDAIERQGGLNDTQGFYIYRGNRLVVTANWMGVRGRNNLSRLTRVRVEMPVELDHEWELDIRKSVARPPKQVRERLRKLAERFVEPSERAHTFKRRELVDGKVERLWTAVENADSFGYEVNLAHPELEDLLLHLPKNQATVLRRHLEDLGRSFPYQDVFARMSRDKAPVREARSPELLKKAAWFIDQKKVAKGDDLEEFVSIIVLQEPWSVYRGFEDELIEFFREELGS